MVQKRPRRSFPESLGNETQLRIRPGNLFLEAQPASYFLISRISPGSNQKLVCLALGALRETQMLHTRSGFSVRDSRRKFGPHLQHVRSRRFWKNRGKTAQFSAESDGWSNALWLRRLTATKNSRFLLIRSDHVFFCFFLEVRTPSSLAFEQFNSELSSWAAD